jgi:hypothetical protein
MSKSLIALVVLAAGAITTDSAEVQPGAKFDAPDDVADKLIAAGQAKLAEAKPVKKTKVRLLVDSALGNCNDVVEVDAGDVKKLEADGLASGAKGEVDYALTLEQNKPAA